MKLHEYQAKQLFRDYSIPVPESQLIRTASSATDAVKQLDCNRWVVKAQVHAGGRGKVGGVVLVDNEEQLQQEVERLLGSFLQTLQTGAPGLPIDSVLIETPTDIQRELYLSLLLDRAEEKIVIIASQSGGMNIEEVAENTPEKIIRVHIDAATGLQGYHCRLLGFRLGLQGEAFKQVGRILSALYRLFIESDASLIEINPLVVTSTNQLIALDAKLSIDDNALYRQKTLAALRDITQEDERESIAESHQLNYISLDGDIGCMVNGAGLAMATMDLVDRHGGSPANFLDVGGGATAERVAEAFKLILSDDKVKAVLVNIFGGIVRCDLIAEGIIKAITEIGINVSVIVRLEGTNAAKGLQLLDDSGLALQTAQDLTTAAMMAIAAAGDSK